MKTKQHGYSLKWFAGLTLAAVVYGIWIFTLTPATAHEPLEGILGIVLGLFICSHPCGNILDIWIYKRNTLEPGFWGYAVNLLILFTGWLVIFLGTLQLTIPRVG